MNGMKLIMLCPKAIVVGLSLAAINQSAAQALTIDGVTRTVESAFYNTADCSFRLEITFFDPPVSDQVSPGDYRITWTNSNVGSRVRTH